MSGVGFSAWAGVRGFRCMVFVPVKCLFEIWGVGRGVRVWGFSMAEVEVLRMLCSSVL